MGYRLGSIFLSLLLLGSTVGFYEQRFERFRWEGNELVLEYEE